jgi:uncharacterized glyoxalase superfamily protein PhnB
MKIPEGHQAVMPYLIVNGAGKFIEFVKEVFGAELTHNVFFEDGKTVMHAQVMINGSTIMLCDSSEKWKQQTAHLFVYVESADDTYKKSLEHGATSLMGLSNQEYGRTCGVTDPFGNVWWITSVIEK